MNDVDNVKITSSHSFIHFLERPRGRRASERGGVNVDEPAVASSVCSLCPDPHGPLHGLRGEVGPVPGPSGASRSRHPPLELLLAAKVKVFGVVLVGLT
jgi:hypothetical protein